MANQNVVADGKVVTIAYILTVDGQEIERAELNDPIQYLHGAGNIVAGLEEALEGHHAGEHLNVTVAPDKGYGEYNEDDIDRIDRRDVPDAAQLKPGMVVEMEDEEGYLFEATVIEVNSKEVVLDFNAPLAGKTLHFEVQIVDLREATEEEINRGFVGDDEDFDEDFDDDFDGDYYDGEDDDDADAPRR
jgi:FKBP-type peptidyl-prolyl cis-trans isomerase SlyD